MTAFQLLLFNKRLIKHRGNGNESTISIPNTHYETVCKNNQARIKMPHLTQSQLQASDGKAMHHLSQTALQNVKFQSDWPALCLLGFICKAASCVYKVVVFFRKLHCRRHGNTQKHKI